MNDYDEPRADIECRFLNKNKKKAIFADVVYEVKPSPERPKHTCSPMYSLRSLWKNRKGKPVPMKQMVLFEEEVMLDDGSLYRAPDLTILDVTNPYKFEKFKVEKTNNNTVNVQTIGERVRKVQFCMTMAAGWGYAVLFHFAARDITALGKIQSLPALEVSEVTDANLEKLAHGGYASLEECQRQSRIPNSL